MGFLNLLQSLVGVGLEVPKYEVADKISDNIEIRKYDKTIWVGSKKVKCNVESSEKASGNLFWSLFKYIDGNNADKQKINMTAPVMMDYNIDENENAKDGDCEMVMYFYVPKDHQENTPSPVGEDMSLKKEDNMTVATIRFGGKPDAKEFNRQKELLVTALGADAVNYDCKNFVATVYDPPFKPFFRHNEIWLKKID